MSSNNQWMVSLKELKKVSLIAAPMVAVTVLQYLLQVVSIMMVGHLGDEVLLSGVSLASSFTSVTGFSLLFGMASALETLCGQAYGAEQYKTLGVYTYSAIISLIFVCLPISLLWMFTDKILILAGQDHAISRVAQRYSICLIPNLFSYAILQALIRYFQTQSLILPMLYCSFATLCFHIPLCWVLVFKVNVGFRGAALAVSLSYWFNVLLLGIYMRYSSKCKKTRAAFSMDVFFSMKEFVRLALPSAVMVCLEWWSYEILILVSGLLPNPKLETSILSICFTITYLHYYIPYAFGATVSTRVSNELGAGNPEAAKMAVVAVSILAVAEVILMSATLFFCRRVLGYVFSSQQEIVMYVAEMTPFLCLSMVMDSFQCVVSGVARGSGWQTLGAYVNLGAYYLIGLPLAAMLAFFVHLRARGLLIGLAAGSFVQATLLGLRIVFTNWKEQASRTRQRIFKEETEIEMQQH